MCGGGGGVGVPIDWFMFVTGIYYMVCVQGGGGDIPHHINLCACGGLPIG